MTVEEVIHRWSSVPFDYDCCRFVGEVVEAWTGRNPAPLYTSKREALRIIREHGSLEAVIRDRLGEPVPTLPRDHGVLLCHQRGAPDIVGVAVEGRCVVRTANSVTDWPIEAAYRGWAV